MINWRLSPEEIGRHPLVTCAECGNYVDEDGTAFGAGDTIVWARCSSCVAEWVKRERPGQDRGGARAPSRRRRRASLFGVWRADRAEGAARLHPPDGRAREVLLRPLRDRAHRARQDRDGEGSAPRPDRPRRSQQGDAFPAGHAEESTQLDVLRGAADELVDGASSCSSRACSVCPSLTA